MENRALSGRLTFLGNPSPWLNQFLGTLQQTGSFQIHIEADVEKFLRTPVPRSRVSVVLLEHNQDSRALVSTLRKSGRKFLIVWAGKTFSKEDVLFALRSRVHSVLENPSATDPATLEQLGAAIGRADSSERSEELLLSIKSALVGADSGGVSGELKAGIAKLEKNIVQNEFLGVHESIGETKLPFYKGQAFADALMTIEDLERTGSLTVKGRGNGQEGRVDFLQGRPVFASCGGTYSLKAIYRMFLFEEPEFKFTHRNPNEAEVGEQLNVSLREICEEGEALCVRYEKVRPQIPPPQIVLHLEPSAMDATAQLNRDQFSTLSSVVELGKVSQILDYNPLPDAVLYESLIGLKKKGIIKVRAA